MAKLAAARTLDATVRRMPLGERDAYLLERARMDVMSPSLRFVYSHNQLPLTQPLSSVHIFHKFVAAFVVLSVLTAAVAYAGYFGSKRTSNRGNSWAWVFMVSILLSFAGEILRVFVLHALLPNFVSHKVMYLDPSRRKGRSALTNGSFPNVAGAVAQRHGSRTAKMIFSKEMNIVRDANWAVLGNPWSSDTHRNRPVLLHLEYWRWDILFSHLLDGTMAAVVASPIVFLVWLSAENPLNLLWFTLTLATCTALGHRIRRVRRQRTSLSDAGRHGVFNSLAKAEEESDKKEQQSAL